MALSRKRRRRRDPSLRGSLETALRARPVQDRSRESVARILDAAARLLDEAGLDGFNTTLLAERADVRVRTVYRYFPDKYFVILALASRMAGRWEAWYEAQYAVLANPAREWEANERRLIQRWVRWISDEPGGISVIKALAVVPSLMAFDAEIMDTMAKRMADALARRGLGLSRRRLLQICRVSVSSVTSGVDNAFKLPDRERAPFVKELIAQHLAHLRLYLKPGR